MFRPIPSVACLFSMNVLSIIHTSVVTESELLDTEKIDEQIQQLKQLIQ